MKGVFIIIPTFNEKENFQELFARIDNSLIGGAVLWNFTVDTWWTWKPKT